MVAIETLVSAASPLLVLVLNSTKRRKPVLRASISEENYSGERDLSFASRAYQTRRERECVCFFFVSNYFSSLLNRSEVKLTTTALVEAHFLLPCMIACRSFNGMVMAMAKGKEFNGFETHFGSISSPHFHHYVPSF